MSWIWSECKEHFNNALNAIGERFYDPENLEKEREEEIQRFKTCEQKHKELSDQYEILKARHEQRIGQQASSSAEYTSESKP